MAKQPPKPPVTPDLLSTENQQPPAEPQPQQDGPPYIVESYAINGPVEEPDMITALQENRMMKITRQSDGRFLLRELCEELFTLTITPVQLRALGQELIALSESHE
jgi:hypothetical protein